MQALLLFMLHHLTSSVAPVIITPASGDHCLIIKVNMGCNNLFGKMTHADVFLVRTGWETQKSKGTSVQETLLDICLDA